MSSVTQEDIDSMRYDMLLEDMEDERIEKLLRSDESYAIEQHMDELINIKEQLSAICNKINSYGHNVTDDELIGSV